jgi:hypothetical protein
MQAEGKGSVFRLGSNPEQGNTAVPKATPKTKRVPLEFKTDTALPTYCERDHHNGNLWFRAGRGPRVLLPNDPTSPEFHARYSTALVAAIVAEDDIDDWSVLQRHHRARR